MMKKMKEKKKRSKCKRKYKLKDIVRNAIYKTLSI